MSMNVATACRDISELSTLAQTACKLFLATCKAKGINIFITETYRSQDRQDYLYAQGRTREGNVVTWTHSSRHTSRRAWDIACNGNTLYDTAMLKKAGAVAKELGITWGGLWDTPDTPHFEISTNWKNPNGDMSPGPIGKPGTPGSVPSNFDYSKYPGYKKEEEEMEKVYNAMSELPIWAQPTIQKLIDKKYLSGDNGKLGLTETAVKVFVVNDRAGLY